MINLTSLIKESMDSPEFKRWFGNSKIVNPDGTPRLMYRGESHDFSVYKKSMLGNTLMGPFKKAGFYFTPNQDEARFYARVAGIAGGEIVKSVYLMMENPYVLDYETWHKIMNYGTREGQISKSEAFKKAKEILSQIRQSGHDGIIIKDNQGQDGEFVVFSSKQIKSATANRGTYDPKSPDTTKENSARHP